MVQPCAYLRWARPGGEMEGRGGGVGGGGSSGCHRRANSTADTLVCMLPAAQQRMSCCSTAGGLLLVEQVRFPCCCWRCTAQPAWAPIYLCGKGPHLCWSPLPESGQLARPHRTQTPPSVAGWFVQASNTWPGRPQRKHSPAGWWVQHIVGAGRGGRHCDCLVPAAAPSRPPGSVQHA
jgi:hypothetical protein